MPPTIWIRFPGGRVVELDRARLAELVDVLWEADDIRGAVPLAVALATELESASVYARAVVLDDHEAAAFDQIAQLVR